MSLNDGSYMDEDLALSVGAETENTDPGYSITVGASDSAIYLATPLWAQSGTIKNAIQYNSYTPYVTGNTSSHCVTGCTNTAMAEIVSYYRTAKNNKVTLTLTGANAYTTATNKFVIDETAANAAKYGYLEFQYVNQMVCNFSGGTTPNWSIPALIFACGVVQQSDFNTTVTNTTISTSKKTALDYLGFKSYKTAFNGDETTTEHLLNNRKFTDYGWNKVKENIANGDVMKISLQYPSHDVVLDGYDSENDSVHLNFGWGASSTKTKVGTYYQGTGWYTRSELEANGVDYILYDIELDTTAPVVSSMNETGRTTYSATVSASFTDDVNIWKTYYRTKNAKGTYTAWAEYTDSVTLYQSSVIYFKALDTAQNESAVSEYSVVVGNNPITITASTVEKMYDGQTLSNQYSYTGIIQTGDELIVTVSGSIKDVGTVANEVTGYKVMRGTTDVTSLYTFNESISGTLTVTQRDVTLTSDSAKKFYDGTPLTASNVTVSGSGFVEGEGASFNVTGSQTEVGVSANSFTYTCNEGTKASNYSITKEEGKLIVMELPSPVTYIDENGAAQTLTEYTIVSDTDFTWGDDGSDGWYVMYADTAVTSGYTVTGDVKLVILDGTNSTINAAATDTAGIVVSGAGNSFSVYAGKLQKTEGKVQGNGILTVKGGTRSAGIGGNSKTDGSNITINGGIISATGSENGAGIGGGDQGAGTNITINGGAVTATSVARGAGIGGGGYAKGTDITINGGTVTATGGSFGAGIGGGTDNAGENITINGGSVTAFGGKCAAGIGGGCSGSGAGNNIAIHGGIVYAKGGTGGGAGIGNGQENVSGSGITISGGTVTALGSVMAAGIGGGAAGDKADNDYSNITISGGMVNATGLCGAGIGGGYQGKATNISITGGKVTASSDPSSVYTVGSAIGKGGICTDSSSNIKISTDYTVKADNSNPPATEISNTGADLAGQLNGKHYATVVRKLYFVNSAWADKADVSVDYDGITYTGTVGDGMFSNVEAGDPPAGKTKAIAGARGFDGVTTTLNDNYVNQVCGGYRKASAFDAGDTVNKQNITFKIADGFYNKTVNGGDTLTAYGAQITRTGTIDFTITGGEFRQRVAGGMFYNPSTGTETEEGSVLLGPGSEINLTIEGGIFHDRVFGGNYAKTDDLGSCTTINGNINLTINAKNQIVFESHVIAGSRGKGIIDGNTTITFSGSGKNLTFADDSIVWGGCSTDAVMKSTSTGQRRQASDVTGTRTLAFDGFTGDFDARALLFTNISFSNGADVDMTDAELDLQDIKVWNFAADSTADLNSAINDFSGDELHITGNGSEKLTLLTADSKSDLLFDSISWNDSSFTQDKTDVNVWTCGDKMLTWEENEEGKWAMTLSTIA